MIAASPALRILETLRDGFAADELWVLLRDMGYETTHESLEGELTYLVASGRLVRAGDSYFAERRGS